MIGFNVTKIHATPRKMYRKPQLMELGDLRSMTLGGSPGTGDSGSSGTRKPASGLPQPGGFPPPLPPEGFPQSNGSLKP